MCMSREKQAPQYPFRFDWNYIDLREDEGHLNDFTYVKFLFRSSPLDLSIWWYSLVVFVATGGRWL